MFKYGYIYVTVDLMNDSLYVGQRASSRFKSNYLGSGRYIEQAVQKHSELNFKVVFICWASSQIELDKLECFYIAEVRRIYGRRRRVYNVASGGSGIRFDKSSIEDAENQVFEQGTLEELIMNARKVGTNSVCNVCKNGCKQSDRTSIVRCPNFARF